MSQTFETLRNRVIKAVGEVPGTSVQTYSEPRVDEALEQIFSILFRKFWWPQYSSWFSLTLDGTLGIVTSSTFGTSVKDIRDIKAIRPDGYRRNLPLLPDNVNPFDLSGTKPLYYEAMAADDDNASRRVQFWPKESTGSVFIHARKHPTIVPATINYLDDTLVVNGATWVILEQEDINPNAAALAERMFNENFADIMKHYSDQPIENPIRASNNAYLDEWFTH